jgi:transposase
MRLARPQSYYAYWFYRRNLRKYWRAVERFGMIAEYAAMIAGDVEVSREFESFLRRKLTPEQRLSGLKTTEAAEVAKLTRLGQEEYVAEKVGEILTAPPLPLAAGSAEAISEHALLLLPQLRLLHLQRKQVADRTQQLLDQMATSTNDFPKSQQHRDIPVLLSLPGVGRIITATMLAEGAHILSLRDYHALRAMCTPVTKQSGKEQVLMRYRCNQRLRNLHHWARTSIQHDPRSKLRAPAPVGHDHGRALRGVADRLLAMLIAM